MHYFIDGYNLLFRLSLYENVTLQEARTHLIQSLNEHISRLNLNVSLVFDAAFQLDEHSRGHFDALEVHFTAFGQTADEYIIEAIRTSKKPTHEIVVTSDKKLATIIRGLSAKTESCEAFLHRLSRRALPKNILKKTQKGDSKMIQPPSNFIQPHTDQQCLTYYETVFEASFEKIKAQEAQVRQDKKIPLKRTKTKKHTLPREPVISEMERWQKIFESQI